MKLRNLFLLSLALAPMHSWASMNIQIVGAPGLTPILDTIYIAGTFNSWDENDANYICMPNASGWAVTIDAQQGSTIEFKFTRGTWSRVEGDEIGYYIPNRTVTFVDGTTLELTIEGWEDIAGEHTTTPTVQILDSNFPIPQLNRQRRIWIKLPTNYDPSSSGYPVLYMMDGQNSLDLATSFAGEWSIDEAMDDFAAEACRNAIVVAVDNGGQYRIDEYAPWVNSEYNEGGEGEQFAAFLAETLKPYIDSNYNTLPSADQTYIVGSSLGALISSYVVLRYPQYFGHAGLFSPAFWFNTEIFDYAATHPLSATSRIYLVAGTTESTDMVSDMQTMESSISGAGIVSPFIHFLTHADGAHSEWYWRREFPAAWEWLSDCTSSTVQENSLQETINFFPNPTPDTVTVSIPSNEDYALIIYDSKGVALHICIARDKTQLDLTTYSAGAYTFIIQTKAGQTIQQTTIIKQ